MGESVDPTTGEVLSPELHDHRALVPTRDFKTALATWQRDRDYIREFLLRYLKEAEYNEKGYPIRGRTHDYYRLPQKGEPEWRPTAVGAEKVAGFFGLFKGPDEVLSSVETAEYVSVRARVVLFDGVGHARGSAVSACSSAEKGFQQQKDKYGGDFRAAVNEITARAAKRAFVTAVSVTCALGELFNEIARERAKGPGTSAPLKTADPKPDAQGRPTVMPVGTHAGVPLKNLETEYLKKARVACHGRAEYGKLAEAIDEVLESRRAVDVT